MCEGVLSGIARVQDVIEPDEDVRLVLLRVLVATSAEGTLNLVAECCKLPTNRGADI